MPRGGKRPGSGRPRGKGNKRTREAVARAESGGIMPLDVMLDAMRRFHKARDYAAAAEIAKDAAPYVHPRLAAVTHRGDAEAPLSLRIVKEIVDGAGVPGTPDPLPK